MNLIRTILACYMWLLKFKPKISQKIKLCSVRTRTVISLNVIEIHLIKVYILRGELSLVRIYK